MPILRLLTCILVIVVHAPCPAAATEDGLAGALAYAGAQQAAAARAVTDAERGLAAARVGLGERRALADEIRQSRDPAAIGYIEQALAEDVAHERDAQRRLAVARRLLAAREQAVRQVRAWQYDAARRAVAFRGDGSVQALQAGEAVRTGAGETADLFVAGGREQVRLNPETEFVVERDDLASGFRAFVARGIVDLRSLAISALRKERFEVRTPAAVCAVRGTDFRVEVSPAGDRVRVYEGAVDVVPAAGGAAVSLGAGEQIDLPPQGAWPAVQAFDQGDGRAGRWEVRDGDATR